MRRWWVVVLIAFLFATPSLAEAQADRLLDRFLDGQDSRIHPDDLRVLQLQMSPDPAREGQRVAFRVTIASRARRPGRVSLVLRDRDQIVTEARDVTVRPGNNQVDFPESVYRFSGSDHCFTVEADIERSRRPIDVARDFCARRTQSGWTFSESVIGPFFVESLDMYPDPVMPGQELQFRVRLRNDGRPIRGNIRIQDGDQTVAQVENVAIPNGYTDYQFPRSRYAFQRSDTCFTVLLDVERTPYPIDAKRGFCAKPMGWTLKP